MLTFIAFNNIFAGLNIIGFRWWVGSKIGSSFCSSYTVAVVTSSFELVSQFSSAISSFKITSFISESTIINIAFIDFNISFVLTIVAIVSFAKIG